MQPLAHRRCNHYICGTRGTRPSQLWRLWGPSVFGPLQLLQLVVTYSLSNVGNRPDFLAKLKGSRKEEYGMKWVKHRWRRGRDGGASGIHTKDTYT